MIRLPRTLAVIVVTIALHTLLLSLSLTTSDPFSDTAPASRNLTMVVRYACMGCSGGPTYFSTFQAASLHYARSRACNQSLRGNGTVVLPNRPADNEAGGSGAAAAWVGPIRHGVASRRAAGIHFIQEFTKQYAEFTKNSDQFTIFFTIFLRYDLDQISYIKRAKIHDIW